MTTVIEIDMAFIPSGEHDSALSYPSVSKRGLRKRAVWLVLCLATVSGVPVTRILPATIATFRAKVDEPVSRFDHIKIVFDNNDRVSMVGQPM